MLLPLHGLTSFQAFVLLGFGALLLALLVLPAIRPPVRTWTVPLLAVLGLWAIAAALEVLKDRVIFRGSARSSPEFVIVRNALSLTLAAVPLALVALRQPRSRRVTAFALGGAGAALLALLGWLAVGAKLHGGPFRVAVEQIPGAGWLVQYGAVSHGRWIWVAGCLLLAWPVLLAWRRRRRGEAAPKQAGLDSFLLGLTATALAMGTFFWNVADDSDRTYAYLVMSLAAYAAPAFVLAEGHAVSAAWARHAIGIAGALVAVWLASGLAGGSLEGGQDFSDRPFSMLFLILLPACIVLLAVDFAVRAVRRASRLQ